MNLLEVLDHYTLNNLNVRVITGYIDEGAGFGYQLHEDMAYCPPDNDSLFIFHENLKFSTIEKLDEFLDFVLKFADNIYEDYRKYNNQDPTITMYDSTIDGAVLEVSFGDNTSETYTNLESEQYKCTVDTMTDDYNTCCVAVVVEAYSKGSARKRAWNMVRSNPFPRYSSTTTFEDYFRTPGCFEAYKMAKETVLLYSSTQIRDK